jgi:hypothetical protein
MDGGHEQKEEKVVVVGKKKDKVRRGMEGVKGNHDGVGVRNVGMEVVAVEGMLGLEVLVGGMRVDEVDDGWRGIWRGMKGRLVLVGGKTVLVWMWTCLHHDSLVSLVIERGRV